MTKKKRPLTFCCDELRGYVEAFGDLIISIGEEEVGGSVEVDQSEVSISNGWNNLPTLQLRFCPFCGKKNELYHKEWWR